MMSKNSSAGDLLLKNACPEIYKAFYDHFTALGRKELLKPLTGLVIEPQALFGHADSFRFTVVRMPELSQEQAASVPFRDWETLEIDTCGGHVEVQLDNFGRMELFYLSKLPFVFEKLLEFEGYIGRPFAEVWPTS